MAYLSLSRENTLCVLLVSRNLLKKKTYLQPEETVVISQRQRWFSREMTSIERAQKFHTDEVSLSRSGQCFWLVEVNFLRGTTNQKWHVISMAFLPSFLRHHFAGKPVVVTRNVGCFFRVTSLVISFQILKTLCTETEVGECSRGFRGSLARDRRRLVSFLAGCAFFTPRVRTKWWIDKTRIFQDW